MQARLRLSALVVFAALALFVLGACSKSTPAAQPTDNGASSAPAPNGASAPAPATSAMSDTAHAERRSRRSRSNSSSSEAANAPAAAPAPPPPVTIPADASVSVRVNQSLGSDHSAAGDAFAGVLARPILVNGAVVVPQGAAVRGTVAVAASSGHIKGRSELALHLNSLSYNGQTYQIAAAWSEEGPSRGSRSAKAIGGGAGLGALIGALAGHGKGAAIGALAGAGAGTAAEELTKPKQIELPAETVVRFHLSSPVSVQAATALLQ